MAIDFAHPQYLHFGEDQMKDMRGMVSVVLAAHRAACLAKCGSGNCLFARIVIRDAATGRPEAVKARE